MKIAVFRALQLGDLLCSVPALRALRAAYPDAHVALVGLAWARAFAARFHRYLDEFIEFPGFPGLPERPFDEAAMPGFLQGMRARRFDLALQLHGSGETVNSLVALFGAGHSAGFHRPGQWRPDPARYVAWRDREPEVLRYLRLLAHLGIPAKGTHLEFPLVEADRAQVRAFGLRDYACLHAGSQLPSRRWPPERFAAVGDALARAGLAVVLTGSLPEAPLTRRVAAAMRYPAVDLAGRTSLGGLAALIGGARLLVCNDTGVSHIAAAVGAPSVVVCSGADPQRWAPLDRERHRVLWHEVPCRPCAHAECPIGHPCALGVPAGAAVAEAMELASCAA